MFTDPGNLSGNSFIDDNHQDLLLLVIDLAEAVRLRIREEGDTWQEIQAKANDYIQALEQHFQHEELILKGANYGRLIEHMAKHREISYMLRTVALKEFTKDTALYFVESARTKIFSHELIEDQDYWSLFDEKDVTRSPLIKWSRKLETGNPEVDAHHRALINYINRLYRRVSSGLDRSTLSEELENLYAYSDAHFSEEQKLFEQRLTAREKILHKSEHQTLLGDLNSLINETKSATYNADGIGDYLKYWFLNHIQKFDKPAFDETNFPPVPDRGEP